MSAEKYLYIDRLVTGEGGGPVEFTWAEMRTERSKWQRSLSWLVPEWAYDEVDAVITDVADLFGPLFTPPGNTK